MTPGRRATSQPKGAGELNYFRHETSVIDGDVLIGQGTKIWHWVHISAGARIGRNCNIGQNVYIGRGVKIGDGVKIQNNVSVYENVTIEDAVFLGPSCVFTNVINPRAQIERKSEFMSTLVRRGATVGANATIVCGNQLGEFCMIGAGAVVTRPVGSFALVVGVPARKIGWVSHDGEILGSDLVCPRSGRKYLLNNLKELVPATS